MQFPSEIQVALLFDRRVTCLDEMVRTFMKVEEARTGSRFNVPEAKPGAFYRLFGGDELMVTFEYLDNPAKMDVFRAALGSSVTGIVCPDIRERLTRNRSHILINVSHGTLGSVAEDPQIAAMLQQIGMPREGASLPQFCRRLDVAQLISRIVCDHAPAQVVHWVQSDQLYPGEAFAEFDAGEAPSPLHIHPFLFGNARGPAGPEVGIRTFGARHFIGREVRIEPNRLPWAANYQTILTFLRVATISNGYIIPHNDTFGPEDHSLSYRVLHHDAQEGDVPILELVPLLYREFGFQADDYVPRERVFDDRSPPPGVMPADQDEKQSLVNEWREKRALAEGIGGRFEVRSRGDAPMPPSGGAPPRAPVFGKRVTFGRRGL